MSIRVQTADVHRERKPDKTLNERLLAVSLQHVTHHRDAGWSKVSRTNTTLGSINRTYWSTNERHLFHLHVDLVLLLPEKLQSLTFFSLMVSKQAVWILLP